VLAVGKLGGAQKSRESPRLGGVPGRVRFLLHLAKDDSSFFEVELGKICQDEGKKDQVWGDRGKMNEVEGADVDILKKEAGAKPRQMHELPHRYRHRYLQPGWACTRRTRLRDK